VRDERRAAILADLGTTPVGAPAALVAAADGLAQATLLRDAAFERLAAAGGPVSLHAGRPRAVFKVWCESADRCERYLRLVGLQRRTRQLIDPLEAVRRAVAAANGNATTTEEDKS
jgi:hypothetical protein